MALDLGVYRVRVRVRVAVGIQGFYIMGVVTGNRRPSMTTLDNWGSGEAEGEAERAEGFPVTRITCGACDATFDTRTAALDHQWDTHVDPDAYPYEIVCQECDTTVDSRAVLTAHQETAHVPDGTVVGCAECEQQFRAEADAVAHFWEAHVHATGVLETVVDCPACDWRGDTGRALLLDHVRGQHPPHDVFDVSPNRAEGECVACGKVLANDNGMIQHLSDVHGFQGERRYVCTECDAEFTEREPAGDHVRDRHVPDVDVQEWQPSCPECARLFTSQDKVEQHYQRRHCRGGLACPACEQTGALHDATAMQRHYWETHTADDSIVVETVNWVARDEALECLYNINKHAKKYAKLGTENYRKGKKTTAKANSLKKEALYAIKERVLDQIYDCADTIEIHRIDGDDFYLVDFGQYSFHSPVEKLAIPDTAVEGRKSLEEFESGPEKEHSDKSLKASLLFFEREFELNANDFLQRTHLSYGYSSYFIGWDYLGEAA